MWFSCGPSFGTVHLRNCTKRVLVGRVRPLTWLRDEQARIKLSEKGLRSFEREPIFETRPRIRKSMLRNWLNENRTITYFLLVTAGRGFRRRRRQERAVPDANLVARCLGRADARLPWLALGDDGGGRALYLAGRFLPAVSPEVCC